MKKRILHIAQAPGGVERYLHTLLSNIDKERYENILVCSQDYDIDSFKSITDSIVVVPMYRNISLPQEIRTVVKLRRIIKKYSPDIVYLHSSKAGAVGRIADLGIKNYCIYNAHGWAFNMKCGKKKQFIYAAIEKLLAPFCDKIIAISEFEKQSALNHKICSKDKIKVIYNGVTSSCDNSHDSSLAGIVPDDAYVVGFVGRISKQKAPDVFIKSAAIIKKKIKNAFFIIVGDGEDREKLESLISNLGLSGSVLITGWIDNPEIYIKRFDIAMLLSRWEGFGLVLPEYMLAKKPIIATKADAIPELVHNDVNGYLVDIDDYSSAAKYAIMLHNDKQLASRLASAGYDIAMSDFTSERFVKNHEKLFEEIVRL
ncbi:MAG: glycosyltransferase family 4 protein [Ruminococcus sp.]|nr:glycosyltransferase family 4 protein [Ruminococcus sp.]